MKSNTTTDRPRRGFSARVRDSETTANADFWAARQQALQVRAKQVREEASKVCMFKGRRGVAKPVACLTPLICSCPRPLFCSCRLRVSFCLDYYNTTSDAARAFGLGPDNIRCSAEYGWTSGGRRWAYAEKLGGKLEAIDGKSVLVIDRLPDTSKLYTKWSQDLFRRAV